MSIFFGLILVTILLVSMTAHVWSFVRVSQMKQRKLDLDREEAE